MNYCKIDKCSIADGVGNRVVLWVSGCSLHCKGCHNPQSWDFNVGKLFDNKAKNELFKALNKPYIQGITFSGGHPLEDKNINEVISLMKETKQKFPNKDIWLYTGYLWEELYYKNIARVLLYIDVLVDGRFIEQKRNITLPYRGSSNQRVIDVQQSLQKGKVILYCD